MQELFSERHYADLDGGILEGFGRLLKFDLKIYVYPTVNEKVQSTLSLSHPDSVHWLGLSAMITHTAAWSRLHRVTVLKLTANGSKLSTPLLTATADRGAGDG